MPKPLQDVADVHYGKRQNEVVDEYGQFPIIGTGGVLGKAKRPLFKGPGVVVGRKGTLNNPQYIPGDFWTVDTAYAVLPKEGINAKWLYFTLSAARLELLNEATGVPSINRDRLYRVPVQDISNSEQTRIAYVLDIIDEAIAKTEAVIAKLNQVRAGLLHALLSYGLDDNGQLRDPIAHPEQFKDSPLGRIPREWEEVQMLEIAEIRFSNVNKVSMPGEEPVRLCNYTDVYNNDYVNADMDFMRATATRSEIERFGLQVGDVIITKDSETPDDIGIPTVVETTAPDLVCGYHLALIRPNLGLVNPTFLAKQLEHHRMSRYFAQQANGTTRYGLSTAAIADVPLHLPRIEEQESIAKLIDEADAQVDASKKEVAKLRNLKSGLMSDLLTGQVRVPDSIAGGTEGL